MDMRLKSRTEKSLDSCVKYGNFSLLCYYSRWDYKLTNSAKTN